VPDSTPVLHLHMYTALHNVTDMVHDTLDTV